MHVPVGAVSLSHRDARLDGHVMSEYDDTERGWLEGRDSRHRELRARIEALADKWDAIHEQIAPVLGEPPQGQVQAFANELRGALEAKP
jgi:hypothetical protein